MEDIEDFSGEDDEHQYSKINNNFCAFVDYEGDGVWYLGIMDMSNPHKPVVADILDRDEEIHTLVRRAVYQWGVAIEELWVSPCGTMLGMLAGSGMAV